MAIRLMSFALDPRLRRALAERMRYCHEMGIYDFYRREPRAWNRHSRSSVTEVDDPHSPFQPQPRKTARGNGRKKIRRREIIQHCH